MRIALITGAGGGLGTAIATRLAAEGYRLALFDRDGDALRRTAADLPGARTFEVDILDEAAVPAALDELDETPAVLINNAGITASGGLRQPIDQFRRIIEVNLIGTYNLCRLIAPRMANAGAGAIVNITSGASIAAAPAVGAYGPSKAAAANLTRAFALEYAPHGVRVNAVAPGFIASGLGAGSAANAELAARRIARVPARRLGAAEDIAGVVAFLCSDDARYICGQEIVVDGGVTIAALANIVE